MIFNMVGGSGSAALNFKVVGGTSAPSNPTENAIWVNTSTAITDWVFSATEPPTVTGLVWIQTGTSSPVEFNSLKKHSIQVCPLSAKQYINGAWVIKTAKTYQGGAWVDWWDGTLFDASNPNKYEGITGGWTSVAKYMNSGNGTPTQINPENIDTAVRFWIGDSWYGYGMVWLANKINLTNYNQIVANATIGTNSSAPARLAVWSSIGAYISSNIVAEVEMNSGSPTTLSVSGLSGEYYVGFYLGCGENGYKFIDLSELYCN